MTINIKKFGKLNDGTVINEYTLRNNQGTTAKIINYGAILRSFQLADNVELTLGFDTLEDYVARNHAYFGAVIGRVTGRITQAQFQIDGKLYQLSKNKVPHHLHGGTRGFSAVTWISEVMGEKLRLSYISVDGEEGYPGTVKVVVEYQLTDKNELVIEYKAETDQATPINLTHHAYWNLAGVGQDVLNHDIKIPAERYLELDDRLIPTGKILSVANTVFDFRTRAKIADSIHQAYGGYGHDQCYDLNNLAQHFKLVAEVWEPTTQHAMKVFTDQPGVQFYTGNSIEKQTGANHKIFDRFGGFCLETQNFPDAVNHENFPHCILHPGEIYRQRTVYQFF